MKYIHQGVYCLLIKRMLMLHSMSSLKASAFPAPQQEEKLRSKTLLSIYHMMCH